MALLVDPEGVRGRLRRLFAAHRGDWLRGTGSWPVTVPLGAPTEKTALANLDAVQGWVTAWEAWAGRGELRWTHRRWRRLGTQRVPERLLLHAPEEVAEWIGEAPAWKRAKDRHLLLADDFPMLAEALSAHFDWLATPEDRECERMSAVLRWLRHHPDSGYYLRQLPIAGLDSKWMEHNQGRLARLLRVLKGDDGDLYGLAGLRREPERLRVRLLAPELRFVAGGLGDVTAPVEEIAALAIRPSVVFIVENLRTGLAFRDLPGAVVFMARGYAVDAYAHIPWLENRPCHYWGDLDTHGFSILDRLRRRLPQVRSLLMDRQTLLDHAALWGSEDDPVTDDNLRHLGAEERAVFDGLRQGLWGYRVRLEQERIGWDYAWKRVRRSANA